MIIQLPENLESSILEVVHRGRFASLDDAMAEAARLLLQRVEYEQIENATPVTNQTDSAGNSKPIWEIVDELRRSVPPEEFAKLPKDGAEQLDHYIYGTPKRPISS